MRLDVGAMLKKGRDGQVLPLTVLMMFVLIGITGLAIDVSSVLLEQRWERSVADAASLAGAQDLQRTGTRQPPTALEQSNARRHAMDVLTAQLGGSPPVGIDYQDPTLSCFTAAGCSLTGSPYTVAVRTPSPTCIDCADSPDLALQVAIRRQFGLTFARLLGQSQWTVGSTSVAAIVHARAYGIVTLRPPKPLRTNGSDPNEDNIKLTGGSQVRVQRGDIGTNTNMLYSGTGSLVTLDPGYRVFHYDAYQAWLSPPAGVQIQSLIEDPFYPIPVRTGADPIYNSDADSRDLANCATEQVSVPVEYTLKVGGVDVPIRDVPPSQVYCFKPGIYNYNLNNNSGSATSPIAYLLEPGVYWFDKGLQSNATVIGGYVGGQPGVALVFKECNVAGSSVSAFCGQLKANSSNLLALNFGSRYKNASGSLAGAASGPQGPVRTTTNPAVLMSLLVEHAPGCRVELPEPGACQDNQNNTLNLPGGGNLWVAGVQYAPSDNVSISGNAGATGEFGQLISWTVVFNSSDLNLNTAVVERAGILRLDRACSPSEICTP